MGDCPDRRQWCWLGRLLRSHALQRRSCLDQGVPSPMKCSVDSSPPAERASRIKTLPCRLGGNSRSLCWLKVLCSKPGSFSSISKKPAKQEVGGQPLANQPAAPSQYGAINKYLTLQRPLGRNRRTTYDAIHRREGRRKLAQHLFGHDPPSRMSCPTLALQPTGLSSFLLAHMGYSLLFHRSVSSSGQAHMIGVIYLRKV